MFVRLFLSVLCFASFAHANWFTRTEDHGQTVIEEFTQSDDGWQDRVQNWRFASPTDADHFLKRRGIQIQEQPTNEDGSELRGESFGVLWNAEQKWNEAWEQKFAEWILKEVDAGFWVRYKVATDCADALYSLRWIFARMNKLEMASRLSGSGNYFTHKSARDMWMSLPTSEKWFEDKRFRAALNYVLDNTYTHSLMTDSYPIQIGRKAVQPGVYHLDLHGVSGHTQVINRTDEQEGTILPFTIIQSTVPREVRELNISGFWYPHQPKEGKGGLLRMRWPVFNSGSVRMVAAEQMPFYSKEQYQKDFLRTETTPYFQEVYLRLNPKLDMPSVLLQAYESLKQMFSLRVAIVEDGFAACGKGQCPKGSAAYEEWSTPSRDGRINELIAQINNLKQSISGLKEPADLKDPFLDISGEKYSLKALEQTWMAGSFSSEPGDTPEVRWGISANALRTWLKNSLQNLFAARATALQQGKISKEADLKLNKVVNHLFSYCQFAPVSQCRTLVDSHLQEKFSFKQMNLSLQEWLNRIPWMMSGPKETVAHQWGEQEKDHTSMQTKGSRIFGTSKEGWVWKVDGSGGWKVWKLDEDGLRLGLMGLNSEGMGFLNPQFSIYHVYPGFFEIQDMKTGFVHQEEIDLNPDRIEKFGSTLLLVDTKAGKYRIGRWQGQQWIWIAQGRGVEFSAKSDFPVLLVGNERGSTVIDFSGDEVRTWPTSIPSKAITKAVNSEFTVIGAFVLFKKTGEVRAVPGFGMSTFDRAGRFGFEILNISPMRIRSFTLNQNAEPSFGETFEGGLFLQGDVATIYTGSNPRFLKWDGRSLIEIQKLPDEERIDMVIGDYVVARLKGFHGRLRLGNKILFQGKGALVPLIGLNQEIVAIDDIDFMNESVISLWKGPGLREKIMSRSYDDYSMNTSFVQALEVGSISMSGVWLR